VIDWHPGAVSYHGGMSRLVREARQHRPVQFAIGLAVGALGAAALSVVTSQGYLHAVVVTGAGYTGRTQAVGPGEQLLMLLAWILVGSVAGYAGRSVLAFAGLWAGALAGSALGFPGDPEGNILWFDVVITVVGVSLFVTPGFFLGSVIAGRRERREPDGSGRRPPPPPLSLRGDGAQDHDATAQRRGALPPEPRQSSYDPSSYAPPGSRRAE